MLPINTSPHSNAMTVPDVGTAELVAVDIKIIKQTCKITLCFTAFGRLLNVTPSFTCVLKNRTLSRPAAA